MHEDLLLEVKDLLEPSGLLMRDESGFQPAGKRRISFISYRPSLPHWPIRMVWMGCSQGEERRLKNLGGLLRLKQLLVPSVIDAVVKKVNQKRITNSKDLRKLRTILPDPTARAHFLSEEGDLESARLRLHSVQKKTNSGLLIELDTAIEAMKNLSWTVLQEMKGNTDVLKKIGEAEKLLKSLRKALK